MRIWHQGMNATNRVAGLRERMEEHAALVADPGTTIDFFGLGVGRGEADKLAGQAVNYLVLHRLQIDQVMRNARQAEAEGYDAFICGSLNDPGMREVRTLVDIPVIGYGQTAMHVASMFASKVAIVAFLADYVPVVEENIRLFGLERKFTPIIPLKISYQELEDSFKDPTNFLQKLEVAAQQAYDAGADMIIPGQAPVNEAVFFNNVTHAAGLPIMNTRALSIKFTEMIVNLKRTVGFDISRRGHFWQKPPPELFDIAQRLYTGEGEDPRGGPSGAQGATGSA